MKSSSDDSLLILLLTSGVNVHQVDHNGNTALMSVCKNLEKLHSVAHMLLEATTNFEIENKKKETVISILFNQNNKLKDGLVNKILERLDK